MPETEETGGPAGPAPQPVQKRVRRRRRRPLLIRYWWAIPLVAFAALTPAIWNLAFNRRSSYDLPPGYIVDGTRIEAEYLTFTGKAIDPAALTQFDRATQLIRSGSYANAAMVLEAAAKDIPVPAIFNDLGVLYGKIKDGPHALRAFRDALARDHDYAPVRANIKRLNMPESVDPGATELEPNNDDTQANAVWLDRPVRGSITPSIGDVDCFWFITPRLPRDRVSVAVTSQAPTLTPRMRIYDHAGNLVTGIKEGTGPGTAVRFDFSPPPNTLYYVQVDGVTGSSGDYALTVSPLRAYDVYEPNDSILTSTRISPGQSVMANIMDGDDTDFYSFVSPEAGSVRIDVVPHSDTLLVGLGMFGTDLRNTGFAPDAKAAGDSIHQEMKVEANQLYYVQIFSKSDTSGTYSLTIK
jgi:hypothetical protein